MIVRHRAGEVDYETDISFTIVISQSKLFIHMPLAVFNLFCTE